MAAPPLVRDKPLILVVDDEPNVRKDLGNFLDDYNCIPLPASSFDGAVRIYEMGVVPDGVIIDVRLGQGISGIDLISRLNELDDRIGIAVLTGYQDIEDVMALVGVQNVVRYLTKPYEREDIGSVVEKILERTEELREGYIEGFSNHFIMYVDNIGREGITPLSVDHQFGAWLKTMQHRMYFATPILFREDSVEGVSAASLVDPYDRYETGAGLFVIKRYSNDEFPGVLENCRAALELGITQPAPVLCYQDGEDTYALNRLLPAPNFAHIFGLLNHEGQTELDVLLKEAIVRLNTEVNARWYDHHRPALNITDDAIRGIKSGYVSDVQSALHNANVLGTGISDPEIRLFVEALNGFDEITPYDNLEQNALLFSRLLDNTAQNSGLVTGRLQPRSRRELYEDLDIDSKSPPAGIEAIVEKLRPIYAILDSSTRVGHIYEDLVYFANSPEAELTYRQKVAAYMYAAKVNLGDNVTSANWMALVMEGVHRLMRKHRRITTTYTGNNEADCARYRISEEEYGAKAREYGIKAGRVGRDVALFAAMGHFLAAHPIEAPSYGDLGEMLMDADIGSYARQLNMAPMPAGISSRTDRMLVIYKVAARYLSSGLAVE